MNNVNQILKTFASKAKENIKNNTMIYALVVVTVFFAWQTGGKLLLPGNVTNLISQNSYVVILATGMLLCILTGGNIDLSIGSIVAVVASIAGTLIVNMKVNIALSIIICLIVGVIIGAIQGYWIAYLRIPAFIVTLAGMLLWRGLTLIILKGLTISPYPQAYLDLFNSYIPDVFNGTINITAIVIGAVTSVVYVMSQLISRKNKKSKGYHVDSLVALISKSIVVVAVVMALSYKLALDTGIPSILIIISVIVLFYAYFTTRTVPGRYLYAMGGNEKASKLSGINTNKVLFFSYVNMAFLSAIAALVCVARFSSSAPTAGQNYELDAIGACFIGGASAYGGVGKVGGVVIGAIFMGVINMGMSIMSVDADMQKLVKGIVLLMAVTFDVLSKKRSKVS